MRYLSVRFRRKQGHFTLQSRLLFPMLEEMVEDSLQLPLLPIRIYIDPNNWLKNYFIRRYWIWSIWRGKEVYTWLLLLLGRNRRPRGHENLHCLSSCLLPQAVLKLLQQKLVLPGMLSASLIIGVTLRTKCIVRLMIVCFHLS
jgi:hypothetical protein